MISTGSFADSRQAPCLARAVPPRAYPPTIGVAPGLLLHVPRAPQAQPPVVLHIAVLILSQTQKVSVVTAAEGHTCLEIDRSDQLCAIRGYRQFRVVSRFAV